MRQASGLAPDLVVAVCTESAQTLCEHLFSLLEHAKRNWPHTSFVLVVAGTVTNLPEVFERYGVMPVVDGSDVPRVAQTIEREVGALSHGSIRGVSLPGFLQMMEWERKSLSVRVESAAGWGRLHLLEGRLVDAYAFPGEETGEAAALTIMAWSDVVIRLERSYHNGQGTELPTLTSLLIEAMRRTDEVGRAEPVEESVPPPGGPEALEENVFRRPKSSTTHLKKPGYEDPPTLGASAAELPPHDPLPGATQSGAKEFNMPNVKETLNSTMNIEGASAAALVEYTSGMALGTIGSGINLEVAAAGNTEVVRAKLRTMDALGISGQIEDILITLHDQYHIIYIVPDQPLFMYLVLQKDKSNLAMARYRLRALVKDISIL
ncbi:hypothetical protein DAETH_00250 [Deinococcus aetherius]|uniref:PatA-like N-terminal domain-containing protein n=1 Tax=Deinococcus aetherius TaxID=200252 RepID=A0ABM8A8N8_9DEIO|nr:hypothetical protein DAETH_00250 [Deinococcus aetherius]